MPPLKRTLSCNQWDLKIWNEKLLFYISFAQYSSQAHINEYFKQGVPEVFLTVRGLCAPADCSDASGLKQVEKQCLEDPVPTDNCIIWPVSKVLGNKPLLNCPKCHLKQVWKHFFNIQKCFREAPFLVAVSVCTFPGLIKMQLMHHCNSLAFKRYNITISGSGFTWTPSYTQSFLSRNNLEFLESEGIHSLFLEYICLFTFLTPSSVVGNHHLMTMDSSRMLLIQRSYTNAHTGVPLHRLHIYEEHRLVSVALKVTTPGQTGLSLNIWHATIYWFLSNSLCKSINFAYLPARRIKIKYNPPPKKNQTNHGMQGDFMGAPKSEYS